MDLRRTGSEDELLFWQSESLTITLKGPSSHPDYPGVHYDQKSATIRVRSPEDFSISLPGDAGTVDSICTEKSYYGSFQALPLQKGIRCLSGMKTMQSVTRFPPWVENSAC